MDYKKKYEDALERARNLYKDAIDMEDNLRAKQCEIIFPELKESEGEKIRKRILLSLEKDLMATKNSGCNTKDLEECIAWLEKQSEQKVSVVDFKAKDWYVSKVDGKIHDITYNPTDKVEPKFKVGDWIVDNCGYTWKIEGILNQFYILEDVEGGESRPTIEWVDKTCHLWILKDAKAGDVLATDNSVFIYAKVLCNKPYAYCGVDKFGVFKDNCLNNNWANSIDSVHSATKEQYDTLMKAMTDAGYTFDFNKKELKKIEL